MGKQIAKSGQAKLATSRAIMKAGLTRHFSEWMSQGDEWHRRERHLVLAFKAMVV